MGSNNQVTAAPRPSARLRIIVSGMVAADPHQGGASWAVLQWVLGLMRLGHDVRLIEPVPPEAVSAPGARLGHTVSGAYFSAIATDYGLVRRAAMLVTDGTRRTVGASYTELLDFAYRADLLINLSGLMQDNPILASVPRRVFVDLDPAFNQMWHADGIDMGFERHTHHLTVGLRLGRPECTVPTFGLTWLPIPPPVVLAHWPVGDSTIHDSFTTVGSWRSYGSIEHDGRHYGQKAHAMRQLFELPERTGERFQIALAIHRDERPDLEALREHGWDLIDPRKAAGTPARYRRFVRQSRAELGLTKSGYVTSRSGWFSDRSACYLAAGRPVVAHDTGFDAVLPTGEGLLAFADLDGAVAAVEDVCRSTERHAKAARAIAEQHLDSDLVLSGVLDAVM